MAKVQGKKLTTDLPLAKIDPKDAGNPEMAREANAMATGVYSREDMSKEELELDTAKKALDNEANTTKFNLERDKRRATKEEFERYNAKKKRYMELMKRMKKKQPKSY